jgi:hypothetical protein
MLDITTPSTAALMRKRIPLHLTQEKRGIINIVVKITIHGSDKKTSVGTHYIHCNIVTRGIVSKGAGGVASRRARGPTTGPPPQAWEEPSGQGHNRGREAVRGH